MTLLDRMRDAVGDYPAHAPLEVTETGREALDALARMQLAYANAINGHSSVLAEAGFRDAIQIRRQKCGAAQPTLADLAVLQSLMPEGFSGFVTELAHIAGGTFERGPRPGRTLHSSIADLQRVNAELTASYIEAKANDGLIDEDERQAMAILCHQLRALLAGVERLLTAQPTAVTPATSPVRVGVR